MDLDCDNIDTSYFQNIFEYTTSINLNEYDIQEMLGNRKGPFFKSLNNAIYDFGKKDNKLNGNGIIIFPEGCFYDGTLLDGKPDGYGKFVNYDGSSYIGEWVDGKRDGWGVFDTSDHNYRYNGNWYKNKKHGVGNVIDGNDSFFVIYDNGIEISKVNNTIKELQNEVSKILKKQNILVSKLNLLEKKQGNGKLLKEKDDKISNLNNNLKILEKQIKELELSKEKSEDSKKKLKEENMLVRKENFNLVAKENKINKAETKIILKLKQENKKIRKEKYEIINMYKDLVNDLDVSKFEEINQVQSELINELKETKSNCTRYKLERNVAMLKIKKMHEDFSCIKNNYEEMVSKIKFLEKKLENNQYLGKLFNNIEGKLCILNTEYEKKVKKIHDLDNDEKKEFENKIEYLEKIIFSKDKDIADLKEKDKNLKKEFEENTLRLQDLEYSSKEISDLNIKIEELLSDSMDKEILIHSITEENTKQNEKMKNMENIINNYKSDRECKICMSKNANIIVMPCGHLAMCNTCETRCRRQTNRRCPICMSTYRELIKIYI